MAPNVYILNDYTAYRHLKVGLAGEISTVKTANFQNVYENLKFMIMKYVLYIHPLSANVGFTPHEGDVTWSRCGSSYRQNR